MTILQSLVALYDRLDRRDEIIPKRGYAPIRIGFLLELDRDGSPLSLIDKRDVSQRKPVAPAFLLPAIARTSGIKPAFLWDKSAYVFGITAIDGAAGAVVPGQGKRTLDEHAAFKSEHLAALGAGSDEGLVAIRRFLEQWSPESWDKCGFRNDEALDENIAFCLKGEHRRIDERPAARALIEARSESGKQTGICLISGAEAELRSNHPQFKGVLGAQSSGAALVSFNADAFESYGRYALNHAAPICNQG